MRRVVPAEQLPGFFPPMRLEAVAPPSLDEAKWAIEVRFDRIRAQLRVDRRGEWCMRSRPGRDCSSEFPESEGLAAALAGHELAMGENDGLRWPRRDGLKWPHLASVVVSG
jgi:ATP-dependent DNA ligase